MEQNTKLVHNAIPGIFHGVEEFGYGDFVKNFGFIEYTHKCREVFYLANWDEVSESECILKCLRMVFVFVFRKRLI